MKLPRRITNLFLTSTLFIALGSNIQAQTCPTGLVSYWKLDETSGTTHTDAQGAHNATSNGTIAYDENGRVGISRYFDYQNIATVPNNAAYNFGTGSSFTIIYWMKFTEVNYGSGQDHVIISKGDYKGGALDAQFWSSGVNGSGKVNFLLGDGIQKQELESHSSYNDGLWHMVACVREESTNRNLLYIDGVADSVKTYDYPGGYTNTNSIYFAHLLNNSIDGFYYQGALDEVAIYNRALTSTEISAQITRANMGVGICDGLNPNITSIPKTKATVGKTYVYDVNAGGHQASMTYSLLTKPTGMNIITSTGEITWTPATVDINALVSVRASNNTAPADTQSFRIYISEAPSCPTGITTLHKLDETSGPNYADYYEDHNAVATVSPSATTGIIGGAQTFTASTGINIPDNGTEWDWEPLATVTFSVEAWVKTSTTGIMMAVSRNRYDYGDTVSLMSWWIGTNENGYAHFELQDNGAHNCITSSTYSIADNNWHHIVGVRNGANNTNKLYVDGVEVDSKSFTYTNSIKADDPLPIAIGYMTRSNEFKPGYHFIGSIDEVAMFSKALSGSEISAFYNDRSPAGHCAPKSYAPVITSTPGLNASQGSPYSYTFTVDDIDATDTLTLSAEIKPPWLNFSWTPGEKTATLSGTPGGGDIGNPPVKLRVTDNHLTKDQDFILSVTSTNSVPAFTSSPVSLVDEDAAYLYNITVTDADPSDLITIAAATKPSWLTLTHTPGAKTATLQGTPGNSDNGSFDVSLSAFDGLQYKYQDFTITVNPVNDLPIITGQSTLSVMEDHSITILLSNLTVTDADVNDPAPTIAVLDGSDYTFVGNIVSPDANFNGSLNVMVAASDLIGQGAAYPVVITVTAVNDSPVITSIADTSAVVNQLYTYEFITSDVDGEILTLSADNLPSWLSLNTETGVLQGIPTAAAEHLIILNAEDDLIKVSQIFALVVTAPLTLENGKTESFNLYPVPASDVLNISFNNLSEITLLEVLNTSGKVVDSQWIPANSISYALKLQNINAGVYVCHLKNSTINSSSHFVIVK